MFGFTQLELKVIALRTNGIKVSQIAIQLGIGRETARNTLKKAMFRVGVGDVALLTRWAMKWGFDEVLPPESAEERPYPGMPKPRQERIKLGRVRRGA